MKRATVVLTMLLLLSVLTPALGGDRQVVKATITVKAGDTLTIKPGSELLFNNYTGLIIKGHLKAIGTKEQPIAFASVADTADGGTSFDWNGIEVTETGSIDLAYCLITNATSGITTDMSRSVNLDKCIFKSNGQWHVSIAGEIQPVTDGQPYSSTAAAPTIPTPAELAEATPPPPQTPTAALTKPTDPRRRIWKWTLIGAGAAAAIGGTAELINAHKIKQDYDGYVPGNAKFDNATPEERQHHYDDLRSSHSTARTVGWILIGAAAVDAIYLTFLF